MNQAPQDRSIYEIVWKGKHSGPYTKEQILAMARSGEISLMHQVASSNGTQSVKQLVGDAFIPQTPTPAPPKVAATTNPGLPRLRPLDQGPADSPQQTPSHPPLIGNRPPPPPPGFMGPRSEGPMEHPPEAPPALFAESIESLHAKQLTAEVFRPLFLSESWIRIFGVVTLINGIFGLLAALGSSLVTLGIGAVGAIPAGITIWLGVILLECAAELRRARTGNSVDSLEGAIDRAALFFKIVGIISLITAIVVALGLLVFLVGLLAASANS